MVQPNNIKPEALVINKSFDPTWSYQASVKKVQGLYLSWKTITTELLQELATAKAVITLNGTRSSGLPKRGQLSWNGYIRECFRGAISKRSIDSYLLRYSQSGGVKIGRLTVAPISDRTRVVVKNTCRRDGRVHFDIVLPQFGVSYHQSFAA